MIRGLIEGALGALCFTYALQTRVAYPKWMLRTLDHPWVFLIVLLVTCGVWPISPKSSVFLFLMIIAFAADLYVFTQPGPAGPLGAFAGPYASSTDATVVAKATEWWDGWYSANGEIVNDTATAAMDSKDPEWGPPLITLGAPNYPMYSGLFELPPGPAPFYPMLL